MTKICVLKLQMQVLRGESCCGTLDIVGMWMAVRSSVEGVLAELAEPRRGAALAAPRASSANSFETVEHFTTTMSR